MANWIFPVADPREWNPGSYMDQHTKGNRSHYAIDIYANQGNAIFSPVAGKVLDSSRTSGQGTLGGHYLRILGNDGITYYFAHMQSQPNYARGANVKAGSQIGLVGKTGSARGTSPHLHFSMKKGSKNINPTSYLKGGTVIPQTQQVVTPGVTQDPAAKQAAVEGIDSVTAYLMGFTAQPASPTFDYSGEGQKPSDELPAWVTQLQDYIANKEGVEVEPPNRRRASDALRSTLRGMQAMVRRHGFQTGTYNIHPEESHKDVQRLTADEELELRQPEPQEGTA